MNPIFGKELIMDLSECSLETFNSEEQIINYINCLCEISGMKQVERIIINFNERYQNQEVTDNLKGITGCQIIETSNITIHTWDTINMISINFFSCKDFDTNKVLTFTKEYFNGIIEDNRWWVIPRIYGGFNGN